MKKEIQPKINRIKNKENELYKEEKQAYNKIDRLEQLNKDHEEEIKGLRSLLKERIFE
jgi:peptidoglycan hydrolase CwlO-like protein